MGWDIVARIRQPHTGIDATPFIGLVMTLLIMVMGFTSAIGCGPKLPKAREISPMPEKRVTLAIDNQGRFFINDRTSPGPIPTRYLVGRVADALAAHPVEERDVVYLLADQGVPYQVVLTGLDALRANGIRRVGLIAEQADDPLAVDL